MGALDLTIVIPTYNRPHKVSILLLQLETILFQTKNINFEIVISDNHSKPRVEIPESEFLKKVSRIVIPPEHLDTAEENLLLRSISQGVDTHGYLVMMMSPFLWAYLNS